MRFLHCVHAECALVLPRLTRTRLGLSLLSLACALIWLSRRGFDATTVALQAGALGAVTGAAGMAASRRDRAALRIALAHPTTPLAIALGRWLAITLPAVLLVGACTIATGWHTGFAFAGAAAAAAVGGCTLAAVLLAGRTAAAALFLFMAVAGAVAPERLVDFAHPGLVRLAAASALELGPALWHYRDVASGDAGAVLHALAWSGLGVLVAGFAIHGRRAGFRP
ncbi:MAG TPA: hypothetical protein VL549_02025 [Gemmatimonadales bacterium]|jgi:hypothetical protein|nr:hypothetical protein [Gemmatimonadales bacterium]